MFDSTFRIGRFFFAPIVLSLTFSALVSAQTSSAPPRKSLAHPPAQKTLKQHRGRPSLQPLNAADPRNAMINELYYNHTQEGFDHFNAFQYSSALPEFERATRDADFIPLDVFDNNMTTPYFGSFEAAFGLDVRGFYKGYALYCEGATLAILGRTNEAESCFRQGFTIAKIRYGDMASFVGGNCLQGRAYVAGARGNASESAKLFQAARDQYDQNGSQNGFGVPSHLNWITLGLADAEIARGRLLAAETALDLVEIRQEVERRMKTGPSDSAKATRLLLTARLRRLQGRGSEAFDLYAEGLELCRAAETAAEKNPAIGEHPLTPFALDGLGELSLDAGRWDEAEKNFLGSLKIRERCLDAKHRDLAYSLDGLGRVARGQDKPADPFFERATAILTAAVGPDHPDLREIASHRSARAIVADQKVEVVRDRSLASDKKTRARPIAPQRFWAVPTLLFLDIEASAPPPRGWPAVEKTVRRERRAAALRARTPPTVKSP